MKQTTTVSYTLREIYECITESFYDIYIHDECKDYECGYYNLFNSLKSPEAFLEQIKDSLQKMFYNIEHSKSSPLKNSYNHLIIQKPQHCFGTYKCQNEETFT